MRRLSDIQIGYIRRQLRRVLDFVHGPAPTGGPEVVEEWCRKICDVDTPHEVAEKWAEGFKDLGGFLFTVGLAASVRRSRPATPSNLLMKDLDTCEDFAHAILSVAVDKAEGEEILRRARLGAQIGKTVPDEERQRAASLIVDGWQITDVLDNMLLVDQKTFDRFTGAIGAIVENRLLDTQGDAPRQTPGKPLAADPTGPMSLSDLPRYRRALRGVVRAYHFLAGHVWIRLSSTLRKAHRIALPGRYCDDPDIPRTFSAACANFQEALGQLNAFAETPADFPWLRCGTQVLTSSGPHPDLESWLDSLQGFGADQWQLCVIDPFQVSVEHGMKQIVALDQHFEPVKEQVLTASGNQLDTRFRVAEAIGQVLAEENRRPEEQAERRKRIWDLLTASTHNLTPGNEPVIEWAQRRAQRFVEVGVEIRARGWGDWLEVVAGDEPVARGFATLMLAGDQDGISRALELLPGLPAEMDKLREWLKALIRDWPIVFDQGWLRWKLNHDLPPPLATDLNSARSEAQTHRPEAVGGAAPQPSAGVREEMPVTPKCDGAELMASRPDTSPAAPKPRWSQWALGLEAANRWHLFRRTEGEWRPQKLFHRISKGRQSKLLKAFADHGGVLSKHEALKLEHPNYSARDVDTLMGLIKPVLTDLRAKIREVIGVADRRADPLPFDDKGMAWHPEIAIGYAVQEDGEHLGGEKRLRFKVRGELDREESADR